MRSKIAFLLAIIGLLAVLRANAEETAPALTIDSAVTEGLGQSPDIQRAQAAKSETEWKHFEALGAGFLPKVEATAQHFFDEKYSLTNFNLGGSILNMPGFYPTNEATVQVSIPIFNGLSNVRNLQAASLAEDAARAELEHAQFQLKEEIRMAFYKALAAQQLKDVAEQNVKTLDDHLKQVDTQKHGGVATSYDVLRVQVQLNEARADAIDAEDNVATTRKKLNQLLGLEEDNRRLDGALPVPVAERVKELKYSDAPKNRTDIQALNLRAAAADRARQASQAWWVPSIAVGGQYQWYDAQNYTDRINDTGNYYNAYNFGVMLKWNLFDGGVSIAKAGEAAQQAIQAEKAAQAEKLKVPYDFEYWKRRYVSNTDHYISKKFDITRSEESVRLAKEEERAGTRTSTETLDAELDLFRAKAGVVNALVNAAEAAIRLELALGREI